MDPRAAELLGHLQSERHDPETLEAIRGLVGQIAAGGDPETLAEVRTLVEQWAERADPELRAQAILLAAEGAEGTERARLLRAAGQLVLEHSGDVAGAIALYEQALDAEADLTITRELADLYALRAGPGDGERAADLYAAIGDLLGAPEGVAFCEKALDLVPGHGDALAMLEGAVPADDQIARLRTRWEAYVQASTDDEGVRERRFMLARADTLEGRYRDALLWIAPLVERGDTTALELKQTLLDRLEHAPPSHPPPPGEDTGKQSARKAFSPRSGNTMVGFRVPDGIGGDATLAAVERARQAVAAQARAAEVASQPKAAPAPAAAPVVVTAPREKRDGPIGTEATLPSIPSPAPAPRVTSPAAFAHTMSSVPQVTAAYAAVRPSAVDPFAPAMAAPRPATSPAAKGFSPKATMLGMPQGLPATPPAQAEPAAAPPAAAVASQTGFAAKGTMLGLPHVGVPGAVVPEAWPAPVRASSASSPPAAPKSQPPAAAPRVSAPVVFSEKAMPGNTALDLELAAARRRLSLPKGWLIVGGLGILVVVALLVPWGGGDEPPAADTRTSSVSAPAAEAPAPAPPTPPPVATPTATPAAPGTTPTASAAVPGAATSPVAAPTSATPTTAKPPTSPTPGAAGGTSPAGAAGKVNAAAKPSVDPLMKSARVKGGKLTSAQVASTLRTRDEAFERCYASALERKKSLAGRIVIAWTVRTNGSVTGVRRVEGSLDDAKLYDCEAAALRKTKFPRPGKSTSKVQVPFEHKTGS